MQVLDVVHGQPECTSSKDFCCQVQFFGVSLSVAPTWPLPHTWLFAWTRNRFLLGQGPRPQLHIYDCMAGGKPTADSPSTPASTKRNENGPGKTHAAPRELASLDPGMPLGAAALALSGDGERLAVLGRASGGNGGGEAAACGHGLQLRVYAWRTVSRRLLEPAGTRHRSADACLKHGAVMTPGGK
jgi:hypothetical protein